jgi:hypothetical protein
MENKRQEPARMEEPGTMKSAQGGPGGHAGEQAGHKRVRSLHDELPGMEPMLSDPGEPHKSVEPRSGKSGQTVLGEEDESQKHPLLGEQSVSMQNELEEQERRRIEARRSSKKKPAA